MPFTTPPETRTLWLPPATARPLQSPSDDVCRVLGSIGPLRLVLSYLDDPYPETAVAMARTKATDNGPFAPTLVCWWWFRHWYPNSYRVHPMVLYGDYVRCTQGIRRRTDALCRSVSLEPCQVVRGVVASLTTMCDLRLQSVYMTHGQAQLSQALVCLRKYPQLRSLTIRVHNDEHVRLLGALTQLEVLVFDTSIVAPQSDVYGEGWLQPLAALTNLRYFKWHSELAFGPYKPETETFYQFGHTWHQLRVLDTNCRLGSLQGLSQLRQVITPKTFELDSYEDCAYLLFHLHALSTLSRTDADVQMSICYTNGHIPANNDANFRENMCRRLLQWICHFGLVVRPRCSRFVYLFSPKWHTVQSGDGVENAALTSCMCQLFGLTYEGDWVFEDYKRLLEAETTTLPELW